MPCFNDTGKEAVRRKMKLYQYAYMEYRKQSTLARDTFTTMFLRRFAGMVKSELIQERPMEVPKTRYVLCNNNLNVEQQGVFQNKT